MPKEIIFDATTAEISGGADSRWTLCGRLRVTLTAAEAEEIAFILDRQIVAQAIWLEDSGRNSRLQKICLHSCTSYIQLGFTIYAGRSLCNASACLLGGQTHPIQFPVGMVYAEIGWDSGR